MGGGDKLLCWKIFYWDYLSWEGKFPGDEFFKANFILGNFPEFLYKIFLVSCFLFGDSI